MHKIEGASFIFSNLHRINKILMKFYILLIQGNRNTKCFFNTHHKSHGIITFTIKPIKYVFRIELFN